MEETVYVLPPCEEMAKESIEEIRAKVMDLPDIGIRAQVFFAPQYHAHRFCIEPFRQLWGHIWGILGCTNFDLMFLQQVTWCRACICALRTVPSDVADMARQSTVLHNVIAVKINRLTGQLILAEAIDKDLNKAKCIRQEIGQLEKQRSGSLKDLLFPKKEVSNGSKSF